jgi:Zn-dependent protease with chaperone function
VLAVVVTAWIFAYLATVLPDPQRDAVDVCEQRTGYQLLPTATAVSGSRGAAFTACLSGTYHAMLFSVIGGLLLLALVTVIWYAAQPRWRIRRRRLVQVDDLPEAVALRAELAELVRYAGLRNGPLFLVDPAARRAGGLAFGGWRLRAVCLDAGLVAVRGLDPDRFRTVVLHELAHLRNRDVATTYLTVSLWRAFLLIAALPFAVVVVEPWLVDIATGHPSIWTGWAIALRNLPVFALPVVPIVAMTLGALVARDAVLRSRELHADARTATWIDSQEPAKVLPGLGRGRFAGRRRTHPRPAQRRRAVARPWLLLRPGFWECLAVVLALQLTGTYLEYAAAQFIGQTALGVAVSQVYADAQAVLIGLLLMLSCWRAAVVRRSGIDDRWLFVRPAGGVALGLASWTVLDPLLRLAAGERALVFWPTIGSSVALLVMAALVACLTALLGWCAIHVEASRRALAVGVAALAVCWAALRWWSVLLVSGGFAGFGLMNAPTLALLHGYANQAHGGATLLIVLLAPLLTVQLVCAYPVAGVLIPVLALLAWFPAALASARSMTAALRTGAFVGLGCVVVVVAQRVVLPLVVPVGVRHTDGFAVVTAAWAVVAVLVAQVLAALICARQAAALAASSVAATLGLVALWLVARFAPWPGTTFDPLPYLAIYLVGSVGVALSVLVVARPARVTATHRGLRFAAVGTAAALGVGLLLPWYLKPEPSQQLPLVRTNPVAVAPVSTEREAIGVWLAAGGSQEFTRLARTMEDLVAIEERTPVSVPDLVAACRTGLTVFDGAKSYPAPPGAPARDWHRFVTTGAADLHNCVADNGSGFSEVLTASLAPLGLTVGRDILNVH